MKNFQEKPSYIRVLESKPVLVLLFLLLLFFIWNMLNFWEKRNETQKKLEIVQNRVLELKENELKLKEDIEKLNTEIGVESTIREKYGLVKTGEQVIVVVDDPNFAPSVPEKEDFLSKIKNWFR